ncbi:hypothetical protein VTK26DRAFT_3971 [Humicola hyalothermophila]
MMRPDIFDRLPRPTALLLLSSILELTHAHVLRPAPRQPQLATTTVPYHVLNVVSWPLQPTPQPRDPFALGRRQENTVCGYIGGDSALPATCRSGSHCVLDTEHNVVGCCPNGDDSCTAGVYTGCVDANSGPQTEVNPYVYSCSGADVCYMNIFDGGFSQFGCGTASDLATTVLASASGITEELAHPTISLSFTQSVTTLSEPTTLGTVTKTRSTATAPSRASSFPGTPSSTADPDSTTAAVSASTDAGYRTGAIVGGTIGGLAVLVALAALAFFLLRRRGGNVRQGPGPGGIRGKRISPPIPGGGSGFAALAQEPQDDDVFENSRNSPPSRNPMTANPMAMMTPAIVPPPPPQQPPQPQPPPASRGDVAATSSNSSSAAGLTVLPPITTGPPMPFQSEVSPIDMHSSESHNLSPYTGLSSVSVSEYPPSSSRSGGAGSSGGVSGGADGGGGVVGAGQPYSLQYQRQHPSVAATAAAETVVMGRVGPGPGGVVGGSVGNSRSEDQMPLTREVDGFSHGFHGALGRIGEEDEGEGGVGREPYRDDVAGPASSSQAGGGGGGPGNAYDRTGSSSSSSSLHRPLWQQNRRQSRNLMWM